MAESQKIIDKILDQLQSQADQDRQRSQELRLSMYLDCYKTEVEKLVKKQFHPDNVARLWPLYASYYNLFKKVINLKSVIYKKEAIRKWYKRDGQEEDENYSELINDSNINQIMSVTNKLTNVNNSSIVRIISNVKNDKIIYEAVPSENISIIQNPENPSEITALLHTITLKSSNTNINKIVSNRINLSCQINNKVIVKYFYWDKEKYLILDSNKEIIGNYENPYTDSRGDKIIPYVFFSIFPSVGGDIWNETLNSDLYAGTLQVNVFQTYFNNLLKQAGYRQIYITGVDKSAMTALTNKVSDSLEPIGLSDPNSKIGTFELSSDITKVQDAIHDIISEISDNHGVDFSSRTSSAQKMSGLALSISQENIDNIRDEQQPFYRVYEKELAEKTVIIANRDLKSNIDIEGNFSIDFYENKKEIPVKDKIEWYKFLVSHNIKSIIDIYRETDPDCENDEEALKRIELNRQQNESLIDDFPFSPIDENKEEKENAET